MSFSRSSLTTVKEKKYGERKKEPSKNELKTIKEKSVISNTNNSNNKINNSKEANPIRKTSKIPRPKTGKKERKESSSTTGKSSDPFLSSPTQLKKKDVGKKIKITQKEEKIDPQLDAMCDLIAKVLKERSCEKFHSSKLKEENRAKSSSTIKMKTAPILNINKNQDLIKRFENEVEEISSILLNTSADLSNTLKNIKNCASLTPQALEKKNRKIQLAMKKVKSLTLLRTKNFMEEAKQLVVNREIIRTEIQNVINSGKKKILENESKLEKKFALQTKLDLKYLKSCDCDKSQEVKIGATGDSVKLKNKLKINEKKMTQNNRVSEIEQSVAEEENENLNSSLAVQENLNSSLAVQENLNSSLAVQENLNNSLAVQENLNSSLAIQENFNSPKNKQENFNSPKNKQENFNSPKETQENFNSPKETQENFNSPKETQENFNSPKMLQENLINTKNAVKEDSSPQMNSEELLKVVDSLSAKLEKKNETINRLNNKLFELHQAFTENSLKYNDLQVKLKELCENLQWNYILWKEIGKLKNKIKILEQNNKGLEEEKKELELSKRKLDEEIISLTKLNHVFSQQFGYNNPEAMLQFCTCGLEETILHKIKQNNNALQSTEEKVLEEKQKVINQLLSIIRMMSDQKNIAHKHKAEFLAKLEELHKSQNT